MSCDSIEKRGDRNARCEKFEARASKMRRVSAKFTITMSKIPQFPLRRSLSGTMRWRVGSRRSHSITRGSSMNRRAPFWVTRMRAAGRIVQPTDLSRKQRSMSAQITLVEGIGTALMGELLRRLGELKLHANLAFTRGIARYDGPWSCRH